MKKFATVAAGAALLLSGQFAAAENHVVKASVTNYEPMVLFVQPGDTVTWANMGGHNVETIPGMVPEGAEGFSSKLGEEGYTVTFDVEGAYVYKCLPHVSTGMVGTVVVGANPGNLDAIDAALADVKVAKNMIGRAIKKMNKAVASQ